MDETEEMVRLLLARARMLGHHCPRCELPLFEKEGRVVCVKCGEVKVVKDEKGGSSGSDKVALERKKEDLLKRLHDEDDPAKIASIADAISKLDILLKG